MTDPDLPTGASESDAACREILDGIRLAVFQALQRGESPPISRWTSQHPELEQEIEVLVELMRIEHEVAFGDPACAREREIEEALADIAGSVQDAVNRGETPPVAELKSKYPELADDVDAAVERTTTMVETLDGEVLYCPTAGSNEPGSALGGYRLEGKLALHPVGPIYLARSEAYDTAAELLVFRPLVRPDRVRSILGAVDAARGLDPASCAPPLEYGVTRGISWVAWEHAGGTPLSRVVGGVAESHGVRSFEEVARDASEAPSLWDLDLGFRREAARNLTRDRSWVRFLVGLSARVARILDAAHRQGVLHGGVNLDSVVVNADGRVRVRWFGITRHLGGHTDAEEFSLFLAPEQVLPRDLGLDWRVDVYGVGCLLYGLLALAPPHTPEPGLDAEAWQHRFLQDPTPLGSVLPGIAPAVLRWVETATARDPERRPPNCASLAEALERLLDSDLRSGALGGIIRGLRRFRGRPRAR